MKKMIVYCLIGFKLKLLIFSSVFDACRTSTECWNEVLAKSDVRSPCVTSCLCQDPVVKIPLCMKNDGKAETSEGH